MNSYYYSGPPSDLANTASLPRRPRGSPWPAFATSPCKEPAWRVEPPTTTRTPEICAAYEHPHPGVGSFHTAGQAYGALNHTAELLAKVLSGSKAPDVTAPSEAAKAKQGISEPLTKPAMTSAPPCLTSLADDLKRSRAFRLVPKVSCPSPFHPRATTVPIAGLQDVPLTETPKKKLALAPLAGMLPPPPFGVNLRAWEEWQAYCQSEQPAGTAGVQPKISARMDRGICTISPADWPVSFGCGHQMFASEAFM